MASVVLADTEELLASTSSVPGNSMFSIYITSGEETLQVWRCTSMSPFSEALISNWTDIL